jgi:indole-3-glycerol phosphate synthase
LIGINNRNLQDFSVSLDTTFDLLPGLIGAGRVLVSESGIVTRQDCQRLEAAGADAVLVGEALMTSPDPASALRKLRGQIGGRF